MVEAALDRVIFPPLLEKGRTREDRRDRHRYVGQVNGACFADAGNQVPRVAKERCKIKVLDPGGLPVHRSCLRELVERRSQSLGRPHPRSGVHLLRSGQGSTNLVEHKTAVILGAAGFIGSHLTDLFLSRGWRVIGVDNLITGSRRNLAHLQEVAEFLFLEADICDPLEVEGNVDAVLDFASPASPLDYLAHPMETLRVGSVGVENALQLAKRKRARFVLSSTSEVYGDPLEHPQRETYWGNVNPVGPRAVYDEAKRFAEAVTMAYRRYEQVETRIARIFNTYGPRMRLNDGRVVPAFISQALSGEPITVFGDGSQTRSFCYVSDNIEGIWRLLHSDYSEPVNIGNPQEMTILQFATAIQRVVGIQCPLVHRDLPVDDPKVRRPDITRANQILGWSPQVQLEDGLRRTVEFFQETWNELPSGSVETSRAC